MLRRRVTKWGKAHLYRTADAQASECGIPVPATRGKAPRADNPGTCVQCRHAVEGKQRQHVPAGLGQLPQPRRTEKDRAWRRRRRRWARTGVSDDQRSVDRNPEGSKMGGRKFGRHLMDRVLGVVRRWMPGLRGDR